MHSASPDNEERRLLAEYETATSFYSWAVRELSRQRGTLVNDEYERLRNMVENARLNSERARIAVKSFRSATQDYTLNAKEEPSKKQAPAGRGRDRGLGPML